jgi:hypothetical protein
MSQSVPFVGESKLSAELALRHRASAIVVLTVDSFSATGWPNHCYLSRHVL